LRKEIHEKREKKKGHNREEGGKSFEEDAYKANRRQKVNGNNLKVYGQGRGRKRVNKNS